MAIKETIKKLWQTWNKLSKLLGLVVSSILLSVVYLIGFGLTSIIAKLIGKHFLPLGKESSNWVDHVIKVPTNDKERESLKQLF